MVKDTIPLEDGPAGPGILDVLVGPAPPNSAARRAPEAARQRPMSAADAFYPPRPRRLGQSRAEFRPRRLRASMRRMALQDKANTGRRDRMAHPWEFDRPGDAPAAAPEFQAFGPAAAARTGTARKRAIFLLRAGAV